MLLLAGISLFIPSAPFPPKARGRRGFDVVFECFSAFGTVGLSRGITAELSPFSKLVIIATMFAGRVGLLTLVLALVGNPTPRRYELPDARLPLN